MSTASLPGSSRRASRRLQSGPGVEVHAVKPYAFVFVCQTGEIELKAALLAASLRRQLQDTCELIAVIPEAFGQRNAPSARTLEFLAQLGARVDSVANELAVEASAVRRGDLLLNKAYCLTVSTTARRLIFIDSDILCLRPACEGMLLRAVPFQAKPADLQTEKRWERLYRLFDLEVPPRTMACTASGDMVPPYFNSGLMIVDPSIAKALVGCWLDTFVRLTNSGIMEDNAFFREQVSLALALQRRRIAFEPLSEEYNFPAHIKPLDAANPPVFVHYHWPKIVRREKLLMDEIESLCTDHPALRPLLATQANWAGIPR
jgi:hypothetical protein